MMRNIRNTLRYYCIAIGGLGLLLGSAAAFPCELLSSHEQVERRKFEADQQLTKRSEQRRRSLENIRETFNKEADRRRKLTEELQQQPPLDFEPVTLKSGLHSSGVRGETTKQKWNSDVSESDEEWFSAESGSDANWSTINRLVDKSNKERRLQWPTKKNLILQRRRSEPAQQTETRNSRLLKQSIKRETVAWGREEAALQREEGVRRENVALQREVAAALQREHALQESVGGLLKDINARNKEKRSQSLHPLQRRIEENMMEMRWQILYGPGRNHGFTVTPSLANGGTIMHPVQPREVECPVAIEDID